MASYEFDIGDKSRKVARFIGMVHAELQKAFAQERLSPRKLTQQQIANMLDTNRSVINRQLLGEENLTLRRVAEFAWALGYDIHFSLKKAKLAKGANDRHMLPVVVVPPAQAFPLAPAEPLPAPSGKTHWPNVVVAVAVSAQ